MFQSICPLAHPDLQSEEIIDTTNALFIEMPDYNKIVNWYKFNKEEKININCTYETNQSLNEDGIFNLEIINDDINQEKFIKNLNEIIKGYENEIQLLYKDNQLSNIIVNESIALPLIKFLGKNCNATINIDNQVLTGEEADYYNVYSAYIKKIINSLNEDYDLSYMEKNYDKYTKLLDNNLKVPSVYNLKYKETGNLLLTGATGFLGIHILEEFIKNENGKIYCIVRDETGLSAKLKLQQKLHYYFDTKYDNLIGKRIFAITGDITKPGFGLDQEKLLDLSNNIDKSK